MKTYHLRRRADGRVILDLARSDDKDVLQIITADSWQVARAKVNEKPLWNNTGYGWYER